MEINHIGTKKIYTNRLILRKFNENDTKEIFENWISDPEVSKYMVWNSHKNVEETERWLQKCIYKYQNQDVYNWGIELKENGILIGSISANKSDIDEECYEIGYAFGKRFWGNGFATESLKAVVEFLTKEVGIKKFLCRYAKENQASGKVIRNAGFEYKGVGEFSSLDGKRNFESEEYYLEIEKGR